MIPTEIAAGVTLEIPITLTAYPASGWTMTLALRGPAAIDLTATADGDTHVIGAGAATTAAWLPGRYWWTLRVSDGTDTIEVDSGQTTIRGDLTAEGAGYDGRGHVEKVLDAIEAVIEGRASQDQERYRINNRELQRTPIADLIKLRETYRAELRRLKAARRGSTLLGRQVLTRF
jgi:hypothetical protein